MGLGTATAKTRLRRRPRCRRYEGVATVALCRDSRLDVTVAQEAAVDVQGVDGAGEVESLKLFNGTF